MLSGLVAAWGKNTLSSVDSCSVEAPDRKDGGGGLDIDNDPVGVVEDADEERREYNVVIRLRARIAFPVF